MALTFSLAATWDDGRRVQVSRTIVASANYTTSLAGYEYGSYPGESSKSISSR
jgi:hypothetical protein